MYLQNRLVKNKKGVGTIFGMVFFLLIAVIIFSSFAVVLNQTSSLENTSMQIRQVDNDKAKENLLIKDATFGNTITFTIQNTGPLPVQVVRVWADGKPDESKQVNILPIPVGQTSSVLSYTFSGAPIVDTPGSFWVITARGNKFVWGQGLGTPGQDGEDGTNGTPGTPGTPGTNGVNGADGNKWYSGTTYSRSNPPPNDVPPASFPDPDTGKLANKGDYYLNLNTYELYQKGTTNWAYITTISGVAGPSGADGTKWYPGTAYTQSSPPPNDGLPNDFHDPITGLNAKQGDYYFNTDTYDLFMKLADGSWQYIVTIEPGGDGVKVAQGIGKFAMDFDDFKVYNLTKVGNDYIFNRAAEGNGYDVTRPAKPQGYNLGVVFRVKLTNLDDAGRDYFLSSKSMFWCLFPATDLQPRGASWFLVDVALDNNTNTGKIVQPTSSVKLEYTPDGKATYLYFASDTEFTTTFTPFGDTGNFNPPADNIASTNLAMIGHLGSAYGPYYGQNLPFVSIYFR